MSQLSLSAPPGDRVPKTFSRKPGTRPFLVELLASPVALKWIMALSGIAGMGFVLVHMIGNLHLYEGPAEVNSYAEALRDIGGALVPRGGVLWLMRFGLIAAVAIHIFAAYRLTVINHKARPQQYATKREYLAADYASRTMRITGIWLVAFILYHLADLTWGVGLAKDDFIHGDPYNNVVESFSNPLVASFYILSMAALAFHLYHGAWSIFQSLGVNSPRYNSWRRGFATAFALVVLIGNISFPVMVSLGVLSQEDRCWPTPEQLAFAEEQLGASHADIERAQESGSCPAQELTGIESPVDLEPVDEGPVTDTLPLIPDDTLPLIPDDTVAPPTDTAVTPDSSVQPTTPAEEVSP